MRLIFGMILGAALTVGAAYVHDTMYVDSAPAAGPQRSLVNWDVAGTLSRRASLFAQDQFSRLTGK